MYTLKSRLSLFLLISLLQLSLPQSVFAEEDTPNSPRCVGSGPISTTDDEFFCGCTWGAVYYRGQPVIDAPVSILFNAKALTQESAHYTDNPYPYYGMSAATLGAKRSDLLTVTTEFAGATVSRSFRAQPDHEKNQEVSLVIPETTVWKNLLPQSDASALLVVGNTLWAGGKDGLLSLNLASGISTTHSLPWQSQSVVALAHTQNSHIWAAGAHSLAEFDGTTWQDRSVPFAATLRTLHVNPISNALWVGGGDTGSALAVFDGNWQTISAISGRIEAIATDNSGDVWVGSRKGLYRHDHANPSLNAGWESYRVADGLGTDDIRALVSDSQFLWVGGAPYDGGTETPKEGLSRFNLSTESWQVFTTTHGLPADVDGTTALVDSLTLDANGQVWAGTADGVYFMATPSFWVNDNPVPNQPVGVTASNSVTTTVFIGRSAGVSMLDFNPSASSPPTVTIHPLASSLTLSETMILSATAKAGQNSPIVAWEWVSDRVGALCTTAESCTLPASVLGAGRHEVSLRVQNAKGLWSQAAKTEVVVSGAQPGSGNAKVYLPLVRR